MGYWDQDWGEAGKPGQIWTLALVGSLLAHGLLVAWILLILTEKTAPRRVVVPVEAIALVPAQPGPKGGGGGQLVSVPKPKPAAPKPVPPRPEPRITPKSPPKVKPIPQPAPKPAETPVIPTPAAPAPITRGQPSPSGAAASGAKTSGGLGSGQGGSAGGQGAGSGAGVGSGQGRGFGPGSGSALQSYLRLVRQLLEKHKDYPSMARQRHIQGIVMVRFTIQGGGQVGSFQISHSSGQDLLDEAAKNTIRRVGQFPPLPIDLNRQQLTVEVPLAFRLKID